MTDSLKLIRLKQLGPVGALAFARALVGRGNLKLERLEILSNRMGDEAASALVINTQIVNSKRKSKDVTLPELVLKFHPGTLMQVRARGALNDKETNKKCSINVVPAFLGILLFTPIFHGICIPATFARGAVPQVGQKKETGDPKETGGRDLRRRVSTVAADEEEPKKTGMMNKFQKWLMRRRGGRKYRGISGYKKDALSFVRYESLPGPVYAWWFIFIILAGIPWILLLSFDAILDATGDGRTLMGIGLCFIGFFKCYWFFEVCLQDESLYTIRSSKGLPDSIPFDFRNFVVGMIQHGIDFYQLLGLATAGGLYPKWVSSVFSFALISHNLFDGIKLTSINFGVFGVTTTWLVFSTFLGLTANGLDPTWIDKIPFAPDLISLFTDMAYLPVLINLLSWLDCTTDSPSLLEAALPTEQVICWSGEHRARAAWVLPLTFFYIISSNLIGVHFMENYSISNRIKTVEFFLVWQRMVKFALTLCQVLLKENPLARMVLVTFFLSLLAVPLVYLHFKGHTNKLYFPSALQKLKLLAFTLVTWIAAGNILPLALGSTAYNEMFLLVNVIGCVLIPSMILFS